MPSSMPRFFWVARLPTASTNRSAFNPRRVSASALGANRDVIHPFGKHRDRLERNTQRIDDFPPRNGETVPRKRQK
jgi:hypothetical protein